MRHKKSVMRSFMMVIQLGISVMVPVFVCILAGYYIDRYAGTKLILLFMVLGFLAGGSNAYKLAKATLAMNEREEWLRIRRSAWSGKWRLDPRYINRSSQAA